MKVTKGSHEAIFVHFDDLLPERHRACPVTSVGSLRPPADGSFVTTIC
jgi:hypothetical protein